MGRITPSGWCRSALTCGRSWLTRLSRLQSEKRSWHHLPVGLASTSAPTWNGSWSGRATSPCPVSSRTSGRPVRPTGWSGTRPMWRPSGSDTLRRWLPPTTSRPESITLRMSWQGVTPSRVSQERSTLFREVSALLTTPLRHACQPGWMPGPRKKAVRRGHGWGTPQGCPAGCRARAKKQPGGAMDGPPGVKWRGQDSNL